MGRKFLGELFYYVDSKINKYCDSNVVLDLATHHFIGYIIIFEGEL